MVTGFFQLFECHPQASFKLLFLPLARFPALFFVLVCAFIPYTASARQFFQFFFTFHVFLPFCQCSSFKMTSLLQFADRTTFCFSFCIFNCFIANSRESLRSFFSLSFLGVWFPRQGIFSIRWARPEISLEILSLVHQQV